MITYSFEQKPKFLTKSFKDQFKLLVNQISKETNFHIKKLHYHFCSDDYILDINKNSLNHDYYTDIITFDYSTDTNLFIEIFISLDRVEENAKDYNENFMNELLRVMIHGILHCVGFNDTTDSEEELMRQIEDKYISFFYSLNVPRGT